MKPKKILFLILAIICCIAADCGKDNDKPTYYMPQDFKDYVMYPVGSYWVYEDSISGETDSIVLTKQETFIEKPGHVWGFYWENLRHEFYSSYYTQFSGGGGIYSEYPLVYNYNGWGYYLSTENGLGSIEDFEYFYYDSLKIDEKWYYNIKYYYRKDAGISSFWALGIGIIRKEDTIINNKIWNLKSYHIK